MTNLYLAQVEDVYLNYINLHNDNILRLKDYYSKEVRLKFIMNTKYLQREINKLKLDLVIYKNINDEDKVVELNKKIKDYKNMIFNLNELISECNKVKSECIFYVEDDFYKLKHLHPNVQFININSI